MAIAGAAAKEDVLAAYTRAVQHCMDLQKQRVWVLSDDIERTKRFVDELELETVRTRVIGC